MGSDMNGGDTDRDEQFEIQELTEEEYKDFLG